MDHHETGDVPSENQAPAPTREPMPAGSRRQAWWAMGLGILTILAGMAQAGVDEEFIPRFHFPLLNVVFGVPPMILGLLAISACEQAVRGSFLMRHAGTASALFLAAALGTQALGEDVVRDVRFDMTWSLTTHRSGSRDRTAVRLEFTDHPGWTTDIVSKELADYLVARGAPQVPVTIRVIRDFGKLRTFKVIRVADLEDWNWGWRRSLRPEPEATGQAPIR